MDALGYSPGFDDPTSHRSYWVNLYLDGDDEPDAALVALIVELRPIEQLVEALRSDELTVRLSATQMLWHLWLCAEGDLAYDEIMYGVDLMEDERWEEAIACFDKLVENLPDFAEAYNRRATCHYLTGDYESAVRDALTTVRLNPYHFAAWSGLGSCYIALQEWDKAIASLRRARRLQPYVDENARMIAFCLDRQQAARNAPRARRKA